MAKKKKTDIISVLKAEPPTPAPAFRGILTSPPAHTHGSILTKPNVPGFRSYAWVQREAYRKSRYLAIIVDLIANAASKKWHLERKDGKPNNPAEVEVIESFLNAPNENDTFHSLLQSMFRDLLIHGCVIAEFHTSAVDKGALTMLSKSLDWFPGVQAEIADTVGALPEPGFPTYLAVLPFEQMEITTNDAGEIIKYTQHLVSGNQVDYDPSEILKILHPKSQDKIYGDSPLSSIMNTIALDNFIVQRHLHVLQTDTIADRLFIMKEGRTEEEAQAFIQEWNQKYRASGIESNTVVVASDVEYVNIGQSPKDGEFLKLSEQLRNIIAMLYQVPIGILDAAGTGGTSGSTYSAGTDTQYRIFVNHAVKPISEHVEQLLNRKLLSHFGQIGLDYILRFDILDDDDTADVEKMWMSGLEYGTRTINEVRARRGEQPIEGGDVAMVYTPTAGAIPVADLAAGKGLPQPAPAPSAPEQPQAVADKKQDRAIAKAQAALRDLRKAWIS